MPSHQTESTTRQRRTFRHDLIDSNTIAYDGEGHRLKVCRGCGLMMSQATADNTYRRAPCSEDAVYVEIVDALGRYVEPRDRSYADAIIESRRRREQRNDRAA